MQKFLLALSLGMVALSALAAEPPPASKPTPSYGSKVGTKLSQGLANTALGWLEIPKSVIKTSNETNVLFGISGGLLKGSLNTVGRMFYGLLDFMTFPLPTHSGVKPNYPWQEFNTDTRYGDLFQTGDQPSENPDTSLRGGMRY